MSEGAVNHGAWDGLPRLYDQYIERHRQEITSSRKKPTGERMSPICDFIRNYIGADDLELACQRVIHSILLKSSFADCPQEEKQDSLLLAARIAFTCRLSASGTVGMLLKEIFNCQKSFWKLYQGAFSYSPFHLFNKEESNEAVEYFLYHANKEKMEFFCDGVPKRMADVKFVDSNNTPIILAMFTNNTKLFKILVKYGATCNDPETTSIKSILEFRKNFNPTWMQGKSFTECEEMFHRAYPPTDSKEVTPLTVILRKEIRKKLHDNHQLPCGIKEMKLPNFIQKYLNLDY